MTTEKTTPTAFNLGIFNRRVQKFWTHPGTDVPMLFQTREKAFECMSSKLGWKSDFSDEDMIEQFPKEGHYCSCVQASKTISYTSDGETVVRELAAQLKPKWGIFNHYAGEYWNKGISGFALFDTEDLAKKFLAKELIKYDFDDHEGMIELFDQSKVGFNRLDFMNFFRSEKFDNDLSADDCVEIFLGALKGQSDITHALLDKLCSDYDSSLESVLFQDGYVLQKVLPLNELRQLEYKGYEFSVIHESAKAELDDQALYVCDDADWALTDKQLVRKLVEAEVVPENDDEFTIEQALHAVLGYQETIEGADWSKAMRAIDAWVDAGHAEMEISVKALASNRKGWMSIATSHTHTKDGIQCAHCGRLYDDLSESDTAKLSTSAGKCLDDDCPGPKVVTLGRMRSDNELRINATLSNDDEGLDNDDFQQLVLDVQGLYAAHGKTVEVFARQDAPFVVNVD